MIPSFPKRLTVLALVTALSASAASTRADDPPNISLDEIAQRLTQWRNSFANLRVVWELRSLPETDNAVDEWPAPPDPTMAPLFARQEWIWADHGLDRLEDWFFFYDDGSSEVHSIEAFNGPKGVVFRAHFRKPSEQEPEKFVDLVLRGLGTGNSTSSINRAAMEGLYWPVIAEWLPEIFSKWKWELEAVEEVAGERCARIVASDPQSPEIVHILWLDLSHDCLVRRHRGRTENPSRPDFIVDEFQRLESGIWFPKRGRQQLGGTPHENHVFVVTEAAVNESIDLARFDPPEPAVGTVVDDHGRPYTHGASGAAAPEKSADESVQATPRFPSAVPKTAISVVTSAALAILAVVFLTAGFWFSHRKKETRP